MAKKSKTPSYIRACDKCGQGKGYHSESPTYRLCDTCFKAKSDQQLQELILKSALNQEPRAIAERLTER